MFDPHLLPADAAYLVKLDEASLPEMGSWLRANMRDRWNSSGALGTFIFQHLYIWFCDELDYDSFRRRFGGCSIFQRNCSDEYGREGRA